MTIRDELRPYSGSPDERLEQQRLARGENMFAPGRNADHRYGIVYQGDWEAWADGNARAVRAHARALASTGIPVLLRSISHTTQDREGRRVTAFLEALDERVLEEVGALRRTSIAHAALMIRHAVIPDAETLKNLVLSRSARAELASRPDLVATLYRSNVLYSVWERDRIPEELVEVMNRLGGCWVPCWQNAHMLIDSGVDPKLVQVVPHPYFDDSKLLALRDQPKNHDWKLFYSIGKWEPRKGYDKLIEAFVKAFKPTDRAMLTLKTTAHTWANFPSPKQAVRRAVASPAAQDGWTLEHAEQRIRIIEKALDDDAIVALHKAHNVYVCSSHGEAWALPAFDAKLAGNSMIHIPWGGTADFSSPSDIAVPYTMREVPDEYQWQRGAKWADYETLELVDALQHTGTRGSRLARLENFRAEHVGVAMRQFALEALAAVHPKAAEALAEVR